MKEGLTLINPITFTSIITCTSSSAISPTFSTPLTPPALFTSTSTFLHSSGKLGRNPRTPTGSDTSSCTARTFVRPAVSVSISAFTSLSVSMRRAARMREILLSAAVRENSSAVARPMPEEAPVMRTVLPARREGMELCDMVRVVRRGTRGLVRALRRVSGRAFVSFLRVRSVRSMEGQWLRGGLMTCGCGGG